LSLFSTFAGPLLLFCAAIRTWKESRLRLS
jgi:hypothetical protein